CLTNPVGDTIQCSRRVRRRGPPRRRRFPMGQPGTPVGSIRRCMIGNRSRDKGRRRSRNREVTSHETGGASRLRRGGGRAMTVRTPLCDLFGIEVPILNVGFGQSATPELAAAVSNAGGLGVLGFTGGGMPPEEIRRRIERTRARTSRPFGG